MNTAHKQFMKILAAMTLKKIPHSLTTINKGGELITTAIGRKGKIFITVSHCRAGGARKKTANKTLALVGETRVPISTILS